MKTLVGIMLFLSVLYAHKLNMFTQVNGNEIFIQSYFASGQGCLECEIIIKQGDRLIQKAITDTKGHFKVPLDLGRYTISVEAPGGHKVVESVAIETTQENSSKTFETVATDRSFNGMLQSIAALAGLVMIILLLKRVKS